MSNSAVGPTYETIIEDTIKASQADFIDAGISVDYLEALRTIWQSKLTSSKVASFPWSQSSPQLPAPQQLQHNNRNSPPQTSSSSSAQQDRSSQPPAPGQQQQQQQQSQQQFHNPAMAALRAMQQVQSHAASLPETANGAASVVSQLAAMAKQRDEQFKQEQEMRKLREEEERRMRMEVKREDDLFGDDDLEYNSSYAGSKRDISQVDSPEEATRPAPSFVAGSLLANTPPVDVDSDIDAPHDTDSPRQYLDPTHLITPQSSTHTPQRKPKKEIDPLDDAINSDLDDSDIESDLDSEFGEGEEGEGEGADKAIVLCMYEKVHRTKNKWKCQLKDGVISIGGKDWVFSKASGEFEW